MKQTLHKTLFPLLRHLNDGRQHSGRDLASAFGLSRASVSNVLAEAERIGVRVHAVRGNGYSLPRPVDWLDAARIQSALSPGPHPFALTLVDSVDSTNSLLMHMALAGAAEGTVVAAEYQEAGRGRRGRSWYACAGAGLTFSVLWRFDGGLQTMNGLSLVIGLAIVRAVNRYSPHRAKLKWPNDILVDHRKLAGILIEVQGDMDGSALAVAGVGLNVQLPESHRDAIDQGVIDLDELGVTVGRNALLAACLAEMRDMLKRFRQGGFAALREEWMANDAYLGQAVKLRLSDAQTECGRSEGVDANGALVVRLPSGERRAFHGGEISLRPMESA